MSLLQNFEAGLLPCAKRNNRLFIALAFLLVGFVPVQLFNQPIFLTLNSLHSPFSDLAWISLTTLGDGLLLGIILGAFLLINPQVTFVGLLIMLLSSVAVHGIKAFYVAPRPAEVMGSVHIVGPILRWGSFPSGHAAAGMSAGLTIAYFSSSKAVSAIVLALAVLIGLSRIFVGAHFPGDVVAGMIIAIGIFGLFSKVIWPSMRERIPSKPNLSNIFFKTALWVELLAALFALCVHAPFAAESPPVAAMVSLVVLTFLALRYRKARQFSG